LLNLNNPRFTMTIWQNAHEQPALKRQQLPSDPAANSSRLSSSCSQMYRLTLRPKPGTDAIRNLRAALKAMGRRYGLQVVELRPVEDKPRPQTSAAVKRRERFKATPYYAWFGNHPPPDGW
jgi:hypothetical protein